jgi:hypothetical protein
MLKRGDTGGTSGDEQARRIVFVQNWFEELRRLVPVESR